MNEYTTIPTSESETKPTRSRRVIFVVAAILLIAIVAISVLALSNRSGSFLGGFLGNGGTTIMSLQTDYDAWKGDFRSYDANDTIRIRDTITTVDVQNNYFGHPVTVLYFPSHTVPDLDDLESGRAKNESWYIWERGSWSWKSPMFDIRHDSNTGKYLQECIGIEIQGDLSSTYHRGDTVEFELHVWVPFVRAEYIREWGTFGVVTPDKVHKVG